MAIVSGACAPRSRGPLPVGLCLRRGALQASGLLEAGSGRQRIGKEGGSKGPYSTPHPTSPLDLPPSFVGR